MYYGMNTVCGDIIPSLVTRPPHSYVQNYRKEIYSKVTVLTGKNVYLQFFELIPGSLSRKSCQSVCICVCAHAFGEMGGGGGGGMIAIFSAFPHITYEL